MKEIFNTCDFDMKQTLTIYLEVFYNLVFSLWRERWKSFHLFHIKDQTLNQFCRYHMLALMWWRFHSHSSVTLLILCCTNLKWC